MKPPILDDDERRAAIFLACKGNKEVCGGEIIATAQRDFDYEHEQQTVREIFEGMEKRWKQYKYPLIAGTRKEETYFIFCSDNPEWAEFKSHFLEGKPKEDK